MTYQSVVSVDLHEAAKANQYYMRAYTTTVQLQVVLVSITPEDRGIEAEVHTFSTQQFTVVKGHGTALIKGEQRIDLHPGVSFLVPAGTLHEIINDSAKNRLVLISVYAPPVHEPDFVWERRAQGSDDDDDD